MTSRLEQRIAKLELARNPPMCLEDWLKRCQLTNDTTEHLLYIPGESVIADFLYSLRGEE